ncbi:MAG: TlpA disulfide reductase family protein, partial [Bacteroidota bacterium]
ASKDFSERNRQHLLSKSLKNIKIDFPTATYKDRLKKYESLSPVGTISNDGLSMLSVSSYNASKHVDLLDADDNPITLREILDQNKGKVVYIDFWASWCAPCIKAFPAYRELKEMYTNKPVEFIFISGDEDMDRWKAAATREGLTHSYLALNYPDAKFYEDLKLRSFPRYLIFDTNGQLARDVAPGPSSDNIKAMIDELLKQ